MNPTFLKNTDFRKHLDVTSGLAVSELKESMSPLLEAVIHRWSVENVLAALFGDAYLGSRTQHLHQVDQLIAHNSKMMEASTRLQTTSVKLAREQGTPDWENLQVSTSEILHISGDITRAMGASTPGGMAASLREHFPEDKAGFIQMA